MYDKGKALLTFIWTSAGIGLLAVEQIVAIIGGIAAFVGSCYMVWYYRNKNEREKELHRLKVESYKRKRDDDEDSDGK